MKDSTYMKIAYAVAQESKCISHNVGAVVVKDGRVVSTGYNGTASGTTHCCDHFTKEYGHFSYGDDGKLLNPFRQLHHEWSNKHEIHAEMNAIAYAARNGVSTDGATLYCTLEPCANCQKLIVAAGITKVVYHRKYDKNRESTFLVDCGVTVEEFQRHKWLEEK